MANGDKSFTIQLQQYLWSRPFVVVIGGSLPGQWAHCLKVAFDIQNNVHIDGVGLLLPGWMEMDRFGAGNLVV